MTRFPALLITLSTLLLGGCATWFSSHVADPLITTISRLNNTAVSDLGVVIAVAKAATPPDTDGVTCAQGAITVAGQINQVLAAAKGQPGSPAAAATSTTAAVPAVPATAPGFFTTAELASIFAPGSPQYQSVKQELTTACAAKALDVLGQQGLLAAGGVIGALAAGQILPLALPL